MTEIIIALVVADLCLVALAWPVLRPILMGVVAHWKAWRHPIVHEAPVFRATDPESGEYVVLLKDAQGEVKHEIHTHTGGPVQEVYTYGEVTYQYWGRTNNALEYRAS